MTKERHPNLPSILVKYDSDFEQELSGQGDDDNRRTVTTDDNRSAKENEDGASKQAKDAGKPKKSIRLQHVSSTIPKKTPLSPNTAASSRSKSAKKRDKDEAVRLEHLAELWDQVKAEFHQERHDQLEQKVKLQHRLIRAQDIRARELRDREERAAEKKRSEERLAKQEKATALQNQGRKSSSSESPASSKSSKRSGKKAKDHDTPGTSGGEDSDPPSSPTTTDSSGQRRDKKHSGYLPSDLYVPATSPMKEAVVEEEEEEEEYPPKPRAPDGVVTPADLSAVPWHHAQLYKMYGRNADYYIHPKMAQEKKKIVNPTLKSQKGHLGASHIWTTLRRDSMNKLYRTDRRFPQELKDAFSSHVREGITNHKQPVYRNFTEKADVPDLNRLMDQSLLRRIRVLRHKTELMYRSSQTNNDRTKVLLFNSPLPAVNEGDEGIERYLPSWEDVNETQSEMSYTRWLKKGKHTDDSATFDESAADSSLQTTTREDDNNTDCTENGKAQLRRIHPQSVLSPLGSEFSDSLHSVWDSIMARQQPRPQPRYHFLTEAEARTHGAFLEKLGLDKTKLDTGRIDLLPPDHPFTARSAPPLESRDSRHSISGSLPELKDKSAYETRWQPLSLTALVEYKDQMATQGAGDFHYGRPTMWKAGLAFASID